MELLRKLIKEIRKFIKKHYIFIASLIYASTMMFISIAISLAVGDIVSFIFLFIIILEISYVLFKCIELDDEI